MGRRDDSAAPSRGRQRKRNHDDFAPNGGEKHQPSKEKADKGAGRKPVKRERDVRDSRHKEGGSHKTEQRDGAPADSGSKQRRKDPGARPSSAGVKKGEKDARASSKGAPPSSTGVKKGEKRTRASSKNDGEQPRRDGGGKRAPKKKPRVEKVRAAAAAAAVDAVLGKGRVKASAEKADRSATPDGERHKSAEAPDAGAPPAEEDREAPPVEERPQKSPVPDTVNDDVDDVDDVVDLEGPVNGEVAPPPKPAADDAAAGSEKAEAAPNKKRKGCMAASLDGDVSDCEGAAFSDDDRAARSDGSGGSSCSSSRSRSRGALSRARERAQQMRAPGFSAPAGLVPPPPAGQPQADAAARPGGAAAYGPSPDPGGTTTLALLPEKVRGLLDNQDSLKQEMDNIKAFLGGGKAAAAAKSAREEGQETVLRMPPRLHESLLHPDNEARLLALTGLASCTLNEDGLVVLRAYSRRGLAKALGQLRRIAFHCQWGCSKHKVGALLSGRPPRPLNAMLVRLAATSSRLHSHESRLTHKAPKLRIGTQQGACQVLLEGIPGLSRRHCTITFEPEKGACYLQDLSTNGTYLNGKRLPRPPYKNVQDARVRLFHGDELFFRLKSDDTEELGFVVNLMPLS